METLCSIFDIFFCQKNCPFFILSLDWFWNKMKTKKKFSDKKYHLSLGIYDKTFYGCKEFRTKHSLKGDSSTKLVCSSLSVFSTLVLCSMEVWSLVISWSHLGLTFMGKVRSLPLSVVMQWASVVVIASHFLVSNLWTRPGAYY